MNREDTIKLVNLIFDIAFKERTPLEITLDLFDFPAEFRYIIADTITARIKPLI